MLPPVQVDRGAIKFVLSGANIMWYILFLFLSLSHFSPLLPPK